MYKSGLVPRRMAWLGMIGGPLLLIGNIGVLFDWWDQTGAVSILVVPEFIWEAFLGIDCAIWGFKARRSDPLGGEALVVDLLQSIGTYAQVSGTAGAAPATRESIGSGRKR